MALGRGQPQEQLIFEVAQIRAEEALQQQRITDSYSGNTAIANSVEHSTKGGSIYIVIGIILIVIFFGVILFVL